MPRRAIAVGSAVIGFAVVVGVDAIDGTQVATRRRRRRRRVTSTSIMTEAIDRRRRRLLMEWMG